MFQLNLGKCPKEHHETDGNLAETLKCSLYVETEDREHFYVGKKEKELKIFQLYEKNCSLFNTQGNQNMQ
jgi:hypothetical protein